jgi:transcriptional regulator with XRE-family HTH domain
MPAKRHRSIKANGDSIRRLRLELGWTQAELGEKAGYSTRLIRKAESGGYLDSGSLSNIAESLSQSRMPVSILDISVDIRSIASEFMDALNSSSSKLGSDLAHRLTEDFVFHCPGKPETAPFIGDWHGVDGLNRFWELYLGVFRRIPHQDIVYAVADDLVIARYLESGYIGDQLCGPVRVHMVFHFRGSKIYRVDDDYDTEAGLMAKAAAEETLAVRKALALQFMQSYEARRAEGFGEFSSSLTDDIELRCLANQDGLPFIGTLKGIAGIKNFFQQLFSLVKRSGRLAIEYSELDNRVVANFQERLNIDSHQLQPFQIGIDFHFCDRLLQRINIHFDHRALKLQLEEGIQDSRLRHVAQELPRREDVSSSVGILGKDVRPHQSPELSIAQIAMRKRKVT